MQNEKTIKEQLDEVKGIKSIVNNLNPILENKFFAWMLIAISFALMVIDNFFKINELVGAWHIVLYILLLAPLAYMTWKKELVNPYTKWFFPIFIVMIWDMFYYSNDFVQYIVPIVFYVLLLTLYLTSMHKVHSFYQTLVMRSELKWKGLEYLQSFFSNLFVKNDDRQIYFRIALALLITLPFLGVFVALLFSADTNFGNFLTNLVDFNFNLEPRYLFTVPLYFVLYLLLYIYSFSNHKDRTNINETSSLDMLIVGIFLGMINLLFIMFIAIQLPFLFGEPSLPTNTTLAEFAREGFFQLMMVMGIVLLIFLFIMRRYKGEKVALVLLGSLLVQTMLMGLVSLKKMYLYQSIKGATVMRYYVEWFDYFLLGILLLSLVFLLRKLEFRKLLDVVVIVAILTFTLIISLNVESMVASHNIEKFKDKPSELDTYALSKLSIDALPVISSFKLEITDTTRYIRSENREVTLYWYQELTRDNCHEFARYHYGYCSKLKAYGAK